MPESQHLGIIKYTDGYWNFPAGEEPQNCMAPGSRNAVVTGSRHTRAFRGLGAIGPGARQMFQLKATYGGLGDYISGGTIEGNGSLFSYIANTIWTIGAGQVSIAGVDIAGYLASGNLQLLVPRNGSYTDPDSGPYFAGLSQPSSPDVAVLDTPGAGFTGLLDGVYSAKIARLRSITGARSIASATSAVIVCSLKSARLTFPLAALGQDYWAMFWTQAGFGGIGPHYRYLPETLNIAERDLERDITDAVLNGTTTVTSATALFTSADTGKHFVLVGAFGTHDTTIQSVTNGTTAIMTDSTLAVESGVDATITAYAGGIDRSIEVEFQDGDLTPETAWVDDYPPPVGTHAWPIENVVNVGGCYADANVDPTSTAPGTVIAVSLKNAPESYRPIDLLYLPEPIVGVQQRMGEQFIWIGCRNSVHVESYTGADVGPACSLSTIWSDVGIANPHNWCQVQGIIFAYVAKAGAVTLGQMGQPDNSFALAVQRDMEDWTVEDTRVGYHADTQQVVYMNGNQALAYNLQSGRWSPFTYFADFADGVVLSCVAVKGQLKVVLNDVDVHTLYDYDDYDVTKKPVMTMMSGWKRPGEGLTAVLEHFAGAAEVDNTDTSVYVSVHRNLRKTAIADGVMNSASNLLTSATANWVVGDRGKFVLVTGAGAAGGFLLGRVGTVNSATEVAIVVPTGVLTGAAALNASTSVTSAHVVIAQKIFSHTPGSTGQHDFQTKRDQNIREAYSYAVGVTLQSTGGKAQSLYTNVYGYKDGIHGGLAT